MANVAKLPTSKLILFALGQFGWSLSSFGVANLMNYFYMPPESGKVALFPTYIHTGRILGFLTVLGIITAIARTFDAITNPLIANWSDRSTSRLGRRTFFMAFSALPVALLSVLVFLPIAPTESPLNALWLAGVLLAFYFFFVCYTTPYTALLSEYGHTPEEKLSLSTALSVTWALGFALGQGVFAIQPIVEQSLGMSPARAFQFVMAAYSSVSLVCMLLPVLFVKERDYAEPHVSKDNVRQALAAAFSNRNFVRFALADLTYWVALTFIQMGMVFYFTTLLHPKDDIREDTALVTTLMTVMFLASFVCYLPVNIATRRLGKKRVMLVGFAMFSLVFLLVAAMGVVPMPKMIYAYLVAIVAAVPVAIFGILPTVVVADVAEGDGHRSGSHKAAIFFGTRTFVMNLGIALANFLFPSFLLLGKDVQNPFGVRLSAAAAFVFCFLGLLLFSRYDEEEVLADVRNKYEKQDSKGAPAVIDGA
ncbi:MAG: MFS transporter [Polyangiaceae bacterium]|nr:MFS transporter [Polyangiaceae bacterium]